MGEVRTGLQQACMHKWPTSGSCNDIWYTEMLLRLCHTVLKLL